MGVLPSYIVMRVGAGLIADKEKLTDSNAAWIGIGFTVADGGLFVLLFMLIIMGLAARRSKAEQPASQGALTAVTVLGGIVLAAYVVAIYAMTAKPQ
jgi:cytochrome b561